MTWVCCTFWGCICHSWNWSRPVTSFHCWSQQIDSASAIVGASSVFRSNQQGPCMFSTWCKCHVITTAVNKQRNIGLPTCGDWCPCSPAVVWSTETLFVSRQFPWCSGKNSRMQWMQDLPHDRLALLGRTFCHDRPSSQCKNQNQVVTSFNAETIGGWFCHLSKCNCTIMQHGSQWFWTSIKSGS